MAMELTYHGWLVATSCVKVWLLSEASFDVAVYILGATLPSCMNAQQHHQPQQQPNLIFNFSMFLLAIQHLLCFRRGSAGVGNFVNFST